MAASWLHGGLLGLLCGESHGRPLHAEHDACENDEIVHHSIVNGAVLLIHEARPTIEVCKFLHDSQYMGHLLREVMGTVPAMAMPPYSPVAKESAVTFVVS